MPEPRCRGACRLTRAPAIVGHHYPLRASVPSLLIRVDHVRRLVAPAGPAIRPTGLDEVLFDQASVRRARCACVDPQVAMLVHTVIVEQPRLRVPANPDVPLPVSPTAFLDVRFKIAHDLLVR